MSVVLSDSRWPLLSSQYGPRQYISGADDGMVYCPRRLSHLGISRCGEYQSRDGCGRGCVNAATEERLAELAAVVRREMEGGELSMTSKGDLNVKELVVALRRAQTAIDAAAEDLRRVGYGGALPAIEAASSRLRGDAEAAEEFAEMFRNASPKSKAPSPQRKTAPRMPIGTRVLKRRPEFAEISAPEAIVKILAVSPDPLPRADIARAIFQIDTEKDLKKALASVGSQLSAGARKGVWRALGDGRYSRSDP